jgi:AcrR family transcriptional regulator
VLSLPALTPEDAMPYPADHRDRTRTRIVRSARTLFNRHGFEKVTIDDIMALAGLTRGGFYTYFKTKSDLYAEAVSLALSETPWSRWDGVSVDFAAADAAQQLIRTYLSNQHLEDVDASCPMVALPGDVARSDPTVKRAFEGVFAAMVGLFQESLSGNRSANRKRALAIAGMCVGGMVVARSIDSPGLAKALRDAAMDAALDLGGWSAPRRRTPVRRKRSSHASRSR